MHRFSEQRLRDEVLYLHSLWHQGPPRSRRSNFNPNPRNTSHNLHPSNPTRYKNSAIDRKSKKAGKKNNRKNKNKLPEFDPPPGSDTEWPCEEPDPDSLTGASGWAPLNSSAAATSHPACAEELARLAAVQVQQNGIEACREFFTGNASSDDDDCSSDDEEEESGGCEQSEEFELFLRLFSEDNELREYYEKHRESGEFCCLVCCGIGEKAGKRFKDCVALVQHSISISRTKKMRAHRAYGKVICKVLGWNIDRLPTIVLSLGEPLGRTLTKSGESQGNGDGGTVNSDRVRTNVDSVDVDGGYAIGSVNVDNANTILNEASDVCEEVEDGSTDKAVGSSNGDIDELMDSNNVLEEDDTGKSGQDLDNRNLDMMGANLEGHTIYLNEEHIHLDNVEIKNEVMQDPNQDKEQAEGSSSCLNEEHIDQEDTDAVKTKIEAQDPNQQDEENVGKDFAFVVKKQNEETWDCMDSQFTSH